MTTAPAVSAWFGETLHECVACKAQKIRFWRKKNFQYTAACRHREEFHIYRCDTCGTGFLNRPPDRTWLQSIYQHSGQALTQAITLQEVLKKEAEFPNCTVDAAHMTRHADRLNRSGNLQALDIGSGFGFYTQALRQLNYRTVSINPGRYENAVFNELNGDEPLPLMFENFEASEPFGIVMMSHVLEHLLEPDQAISKASKLMSPGGVLACAVPNYDSFWVKLLGTRDNACLWVPEHVNYFTSQGLTALIESHGFTVVKVEQITRIPFNAVTRRLRLKGKTARIVNRWVKTLQIPFASLMHRFGLGIYIHLYAIKD